MFKYVIVLCAALFASGASASDFPLLEKEQTMDATKEHLSGTALEAELTDWSSASILFNAKPRPVMSKKTEEVAKVDSKALEAGYNSSKNNWLAVTKNLSKAMLYYSNSVGKMSVEDMYRRKLHDIEVYTNITSKYVNRSLEIISRTSRAYSSELEMKLNSHLRKVQQTVKNLIGLTGNVDVSVCKVYSNNLTTSLTHGGEGMRRLVRFSRCSSPDVATAIKIANEINQELNGEVERLNELWKLGSNCTQVECYKITRIIARGGAVLVKIVEDKMGEVASIFRSLPKIQKICTETSGIIVYHAHLKTIVRKTRECIQGRTSKTRMIGNDRLSRRENLA